MPCKPGKLTVLAWSFIAAGALLTAGGAAGLVLAGPLKAHPEQSLIWSLMRDLPEAEALWSHMMAWLAPASWAQMALGVFTLWAGVDLLRLKPWARAALEWGSWASAVGLIIGAVLMGISGARIMAGMSGADGASGVLLFFYWGGMLILTALFTAPLVLTALLLRRDDVRMACKKAC